MHILIIEDDRELCQALSLQLASNSYTVDCCHTGTEALYCAMKDSYDLILLDRMLPEIDGLSIASDLAKVQEIPLTVSNTMGGGCTFTLQIPADQF